MLSKSTLYNKSREELIDLVSLAKSELTKKEEELHSSQKTITTLQEYIQLLKHDKFSASSERYTDPVLQGCLFDEVKLPDNTDDIESIEVEISIPAHQRKKAGRKPLSKNIPRKQIIYDLSNEEKICACGQELTAIGEEMTEQLDIVPAKIIVLQHICKKYACNACEETVKTAKKPKQPIPKGIASPGLLAHVLTSKFQNHLPLYRQEAMFRSIGVDIARNTLSLWVIRCSELLQPLVNLLQDEILAYDVAYADESTLQVLKENNKTAQSKSYMWAFCGGRPNRFCYLYQYHPSRSHKIAIDFFDDFSGYLHCDGYQAYDAAASKNSRLKQVGCWYHARRKFADAAKVSKKSGMANWFLKKIQRLANIEKVAKEMTHVDAKAYREEYASVTIKKIKIKLDELSNKTPPEGLLGKAISYMLNQWPKLQIYLEDGRLEISNNRMERAIKPFAVGRKNWLFSNSVAGAHAAANIFSLIETCKTHQVNPYDWLRDTLTKIQQCETLEQYEALMPFHFKKSQ